MLEFERKTNLAINVYINDRWIGEIIKNPMGLHCMHMTGSIIFKSQELRQIADNLDELNKDQK